MTWVPEGEVGESGVREVMYEVSKAVMLGQSRKVLRTVEGAQAINVEADVIVISVMCVG